MDQEPFLRVLLSQEFFADYLVDALDEDSLSKLKVAAPFVQASFVPEAPWLLVPRFATIACRFRY